MTESCGLASLAVKPQSISAAGWSRAMSSGETGGWPPLPPNRQVGRRGSSTASARSRMCFSRSAVLRLR